MAKVSKKVLPVKQIVKNGFPATLEGIREIKDKDEQQAAIENYLSNMALSGQKLFNEIHEFACYALEVAENNSNSYSLMTALVKTVEVMQGARHATLKAWFEGLSPAYWDKKLERFKTSVDKSTDSYDLEKAIKNPYFATKEQMPKPAFSLEQMIASLESMAKRADGDKVDEAQGEYLKVVASTLREQLIPKVKELAAKAPKSGNDVTNDDKQALQNLVDTPDTDEGTSEQSEVATSESVAA